MKVLGLLGGMSWESTVEYYRLANEETRARLGGLHSAPLLLWSVDFAEIEELQVGGRWDEAGARLASAAQAVAASGVARVGLVGTRFTMEDPRWPVSTQS